MLDMKESDAGSIKKGPFQHLITLLSNPIKTYRKIDDPFHLEVNTIMYYLNDLIDSLELDTNDFNTYLLARNKLEQAQRYLDSFSSLCERFESHADVQSVYELRANIVEEIKHCLIPIDEQITRRQKLSDDCKRRMTNLKYQHALFRKDKSALDCLAGILNRIKTLLVSQAQVVDCYISYAWSLPEYQTEESWIQPFLCHVHEVFSLAGITAYLDIINQTNERIVDFIKRAENSAKIILIGTPSLNMQHQDPYWRIEKLLIYSQHQKIIPIRITGTQYDTFHEIIQHFTVVGDWREKGYIGQIKELLAQLLIGKVNLLDYEACWKDCDALGPYIVPLEDPGMINTADLDLFYEEEMAGIRRRETYEHVRRQRNIDQREQQGHDDTKAAPPKTFKGRFQLPLPFTDFTGRAEELNQLENFNKQGGTTVLNSGIKVDGIGGVGKTQLAITFANRQLALHHMDNRQGYSAVIWLQAGNDSRENVVGLLSVQFRQLGNEIGIDTRLFYGTDLYRRVYETLSRQFKKILIIFDNTYKETDVSEFLPNQKNIHVLLTSRNGNLADWSSELKHIALSVFSLSDALSYIRKVLKRDGGLQYEDDQIESLAIAMCRFPLALTQALAYICENNISIPEYLNSFKTFKQRYLDFEPTSDRYTEEKNADELPYQAHRATVWTTVHLSLQAINSETAKKVLSLCSHMAPEEPINHWIVMNWGTDHFEDIKNLRKLRKYSLIQDSPIADHVEVHEMVQEIVRLGMNTHESAVCINTVAKILELDIVRPDSYQANERRQRALIPHLKSASLLAEKNPDVKVEILAVLKQHLGTIYAKFGHHKEAIVCLEEALAIFRGSAINIKDITKKLSVNLAAEYASVGEYQSAIRILEDLLKEMLNSREYSPIDVAMTQTNLGNAYRLSGKYKEAKSCYTQSLVFKELCLGKEHPDLISTLFGLGIISRSTGDPINAIKYYDRAYDIMSKNFQKDDHHVGRVLNNLGNAYAELGKYEKALKYLREALVNTQKNYSKSHPETGMTMLSLASIHRKLGDGEASKRLNEQVLVIYESFYGKSHYMTAKALSNLGNSYLELNQPEQAIKLLLRSLVMIDQTYGKLHLESAKTLRNIGIALTDLKQYNQAKIFYGRALLVEKREYGINHIETASTLVMLAQLYQTCGNNEAALARLEHCVRVFSLRYGPEHEQTLKIRMLIFQVLDVRDQMLRLAISSNDPILLTPLKNQLIEKYKKYNIGENNLEKALRICAHQNDIDGLRLLIQLGVQIDSPGMPSGNTALHLAMMAGNMRCVEILIYRGADPSRVNDSHKNVFDLAGDHGAALEQIISSRNSLDMNNQDDTSRVDDYIQESLQNEISSIM